MTKKRKLPARPRTSMHLAGNHTRATLLLDFASVAAMQYSQAVAKRLGGLTVPAAVVARRALVVYALHIEQQTREERAHAELRALKEASQGLRVADHVHSLTTEEEAQAQALERIKALSHLAEGEPVPSFRETLHSRAVITARAEARAGLEQRHAELLASIASTPWARLKGISKTLTDQPSP